MAGQFLRLQLMALVLSIVCLGATGKNPKSVDKDPGLACSAVQEMSKVVHAGYEALHENATDWEGELSDARKGELAQEAIDDACRDGFEQHAIIGVLDDSIDPEEAQKSEEVVQGHSRKWVDLAKWADAMEDEYHGDDDVMPNFSVDTMGQPAVAMIRDACGKLMSFLGKFYFEACSFAKTVPTQETISTLFSKKARVCDFYVRPAHLPSIEEQMKINLEELKERKKIEQANMKKFIDQKIEGHEAKQKGQKEKVDL